MLLSPLTCRWYKRECSEVDQETVVSAWASLGNYIARNLRQGRAVAVPKLGLFTFTPPEVDLAVRSQALNRQGTTNYHEREKDRRQLVFIISNDSPLKCASAIVVSHNSKAYRSPSTHTTLNRYCFIFLFRSEAVPVEIRARGHPSSYR